MFKPIESPAPQDVFDILKTTADEIDLKEAQRNQRDPKRKKFIEDLATYLQDYQKHQVAKPAGYYEELKRVLNSRTTELINLISACQQNNLNRFAQIIKAMDLEVLKQMGQINAITQEITQKTVHIRGSRAFETLPAQGIYPAQVGKGGGYRTRRTA